MTRRKVKFPLRNKVSGRHSGFDFKKLVEFRDQIQRTKQSTLNEINKQAAEKLAEVVCERLKENTPIGVKFDKLGRFNGFGGYMRSNWRIKEVVQHRRVLGAKVPEFSMVVENDVPYAKAVEDGHKQKVGRYVPHIQRALSKPYVEGLNIVGNTVEELRASGELDRILEETATKLVKETFGGK